jgi:NADPH-dependent 2,4-dienoyl-CoA reductase/sulfur reductase-like enzyme
VKFRLRKKVSHFHNGDGRVTAVELDDGERLPADFVVVGIGVDPATGFLRDSGLTLDNKGRALLVDENLQTSDPHIYAAGDIASYINHRGKRERIEHWRVAEQHGMMAAHNMLGSNHLIHQHVPFFWTNQWDIQLRYVGHASNWDAIVYRGQPEAKDFIAFYLSNRNLLAAAGCNRNLEMAALEVALKQRILLTPEQLQDDNLNLVDLIRVR